MNKEKAMKILKDFYDKSTLFSVRTALDTIIPELRESEDKKIREKLIHLVKKSHEQGGYALHKWESDEMLAWLEKQGEHANFLSKIQVGDKVTRNEAGVLVNISQLERVAKPRRDKPADKVESKFKVGDWVVQENIGTYKVVEVCESWYEVIDIEDNHYSISFDKEYMCHLWSIQDAKDGDVLAYVTDEEDLWLMIYWSLYEPYEGHVHYHALLVNDNFSDKGTCCICINNLKPATKEQRDTLMKAMTDAGWEFDFEKKELKKIEQKSQRMVSAEVKEAMYDKPTDEEMKELFRTEYEKGRADTIAEMKSSWSEKDEKILNNLIDYIKVDDALQYSEKQVVNWLKSLKQRIGG